MKIIQCSLVAGAAAVSSTLPVPDLRREHSAPAPPPRDPPRGQEPGNDRLSRSQSVPLDLRTMPERYLFPLFDVKEVLPKETQE